MKLPLQGTRVLELTHVWSGPLCGQVLADLGAEVIRIESHERLDIHRRGGPYPDKIAGINRSGTWNAQNRNKLGCTLDLKSAEGKSLFLELVAKSDVVIENFTPETMSRLGLGFEVLKQANPHILLLSLSGYGHTGPLRKSLAYGPMMDAATGLSSVTNYGDGIPRAVNGWAADVGGALYGCAALLRALHETPRQARHLDISQFEAGVMFVAGPLMDILNGSEPASAGLRMLAPTLGTEQWVALSAGTLEEITSLFDLLAGRSATSSWIRRLHLEGATACAHTLQPLFEQWAAVRERPLALAELATAGVPAVPISQLADLLDDSVLKEAGAWCHAVHAETGATQSYGPAIRLQDGSGVHPDYPRAAPLFGGDNDYVFGSILGLDAGKRERHDLK